MHVQFNRLLFVLTTHRAKNARRVGFRAALAAIVSIVGFAASAEESMFGFVYTTDLLPQGARKSNNG